MSEEKKEDIRKYISEQIQLLTKDLEDPTKYKKNPHPSKMSIITKIKDGVIDNANG